MQNKLKIKYRQESHRYFFIALLFFILYFSFFITVPQAFAAIGTSDKVTAAASSGLDNGLVGYWTMDSKDINWTANTMKDKSGNGIGYYNTVTVSGTLTPDATGVYTAKGMYNGEPYYQRGSDSWYLWYYGYSGNHPFWEITTSLGSIAGTRYTMSFSTITAGIPAPDGVNYAAANGASGTAIASSNTSSGVYYIDPIPAAIVGLSTSTSPMQGKIGQALRFNGTNSMVNVGDINSLNFPGVSYLTFSAWVKTTNNSLRQTIFNKYGYSAKVGYVFNLSTSGQPSVTLANSGAYASAYRTQSVADGKWHHVVLVINGTNKMQLYIDGTDGTYPTQQNGIAIDSPAGDIAKIGERSLTGEGADRFAGQLDDVRIYNRVLSVAEIQKLYRLGSAKLGTSDKVAVATTTSPAAGIDNGLVGYWTMDSKDTNWTTNKITDRSGNGNTGSLLGLTNSTSTAQGKIGQALKFDGVTAHIDAPDSNSLNVTGNVSVSLWVKLIKGGKNTHLVQKYNSNGGYIMVVDSNNYFSALIYNGTTYVSLSSNRQLTLNQWYHLVAIYNSNGSYDTYVNGIRTNTKSPSGSVGSSAGGVLHLAYQGWYGQDNQTLNGALDDVRIYNRALGANEVAQLYRLGQTKLGVSDKVAVATTTSPAAGIDNGLVGYWTMDAKDINWPANTIKDKSGNGTGYYNTLTVSGSLTPDATGVYTFTGMNDGKPYYRRGSDNWYVSWNAANSVWLVATMIGTSGGSYKWQVTNDPINNTYGPGNGSTGNATVSSNAASGIGYVLPNTAALINLSTSTSPVQGKIGQSLKFDGVGSCINAGSGGALNITGPITVSAWINPKVAQQGDIVVRDRDSNAAQSQYYLTFNSARHIYFVISDGTNIPVLTSLAALNLNKWYLVTGVWDGTTNANSMKLYLNGVFDRSAQSTASAIQSVNMPAFIGCDTNRYYFPGPIDDVRVYNRPLSATEIQKLYNMGR